MQADQTQNISSPKLFFAFGPGDNPYQNLAREAALLQAVQPGEIILYLWQNHDTVVIGRNQNAREECKIEHLQQDGGFLARRLSGGGAVFHDKGNLNFTFLAHRDTYNVQRQLQVILQAVRSFGIPAQQTGRNDLTVNGFKFSGNAFYSTGEQKCHHGTLLLCSHMEKLAGYLAVSPQKLQAHAVASVRARVVNLCTLQPHITVSAMQQALLAAFGQEYGAAPQPLPPRRTELETEKAWVQKFSGEAWLMGVQRAFSHTCTGRFAWGGLEIGLQVHQGKITYAAVYTDALEADAADVLCRVLKGSCCTAQGVEEALLPLQQGTCGPEIAQMARDTAALLQGYFAKGGKEQPCGKL